MDARQLLTQILAKDVGDLSGAIRLADLDGWDSLKTVRLVIALEGAIGKPLAESDIEGLKTVADIDHILAASS